MSRRAVILAGGKGTRLRPYTIVLPKPLMPIGEFPILEVIVRQLASQGFSHITLAVNHQAEIIRAFFQGGSHSWGAKIDFSVEDRPLSTIAPLRLIDDLPEDFLVMNGDILTDLDYRALFDFHLARKSLFTISTHRREQLIDYGVLDCDDEGRLVAFREKPRIACEVSMGVYVASRRILEGIPADRPYGLDHLVLDLLAAGTPPTVRRYDGFWLDIGRPDDYATAIEEFEARRAGLLRE